MELKPIFRIALNMNMQALYKCIFYTIDRKRGTNISDLYSAYICNEQFEEREKKIQIELQLRVWQKFRVF